MKPSRWHMQPTHEGIRRSAGLWALLATALLLAGCAPESNSTDEASAAERETSLVKVINVEVTHLAPGPFEEYIRLTGVAKPEDDIQIAAEEPGRVVKVFVDKGESVRKGQRLFQIDDRLLHTMVATAEAESAFAADAFERQKAVWDNKIGTEISYLERKNLAAVTAANVEGLRIRLQNTLIRSPIAGVLDTRHVDEGEMVATGTNMGRVLNSESIKIEVGVPERYAADIRRGGRVLVNLDVLGDEVFEGEIHFVGGAVDPGNRTFPIEIELDNPDNVIKPQMIANARVVRNTFDSAIVVPQQALRYTENGAVAYVVVQSEQGAVAEERLVETGPSYADRIVVEKGLQSGDQLVTRGQLQVAHGSRVEIVGGKGSVLP